MGDRGAGPASETFVGADRPWRALAVIAVGMVIIYAYAFSYPTLFPEYAWLWSINYGLTGSDLLAKYVEFDGGWYKPTELFVYFSLLGRILDWHSVYQFRVVTLLELYGLALLIYAVVLKGFPQDRPAALLTALLFVAHPTLFIITYENLGQVLLYALFVLGSALCYLSLRRKTRWGSGAMLVLGLILYAMALTCREQSVALPAVLLATYVIGRISRRGAGPFDAATAFVNRLRQAFIALSGGLTAVYWHLHVSRMIPLSGGYRNVFVWSWVKRNAIILPEWLLYYFSDPDSSYLLKPNALTINTLTGAALSLVAVGAWAWALRKTRARTLTELAYLAAWTLGFLAIPIYSGGEPWHVLLPVAGVSALFSVALVRVVGAVRPVALRQGAWGLLLVLVSALGAYNFRQQFLHARPNLYRLNTQAILIPPVPRESMPRGALVYYNSMGLAEWNFGAGHLFDFTYLDPLMKERGVQDAERDDLEIASDWLAAPHAFYFVWRDDQWRDETSAYRAVALGGVQQALSQCVAAGECQTVDARLKTIVEHHPELQTFERQRGCLSQLQDPECQTVLGQTQQ